MLVIELQYSKGSYLRSLVMDTFMRCPRHFLAETQTHEFGSLDTMISTVYYVGLSVMSLVAARSKHDNGKRNQHQEAVSQHSSEPNKSHES